MYCNLGEILWRQYLKNPAFSAVNCFAAAGDGDGVAAASASLASCARLATRFAASAYFDTSASADTATDFFLGIKKTVIASNKDSIAKLCSENDEFFFICVKKPDNNSFISW